MPNFHNIPLVTVVTGILGSTSFLWAVWGAIFTTAYRIVEDSAADTLEAFFQLLSPHAADADNFKQSDKYLKRTRAGKDHWSKNAMWFSILAFILMGVAFATLSLLSPSH